MFLEILRHLLHLGLLVGGELVGCRAKELAAQLVQFPQGPLHLGLHASLHHFQRLALGLQLIPLGPQTRQLGPRGLELLPGLAGLAGWVHAPHRATIRRKSACKVSTNTSLSGTFRVRSRSHRLRPAVLPSGCQLAAR